MFQPQLLGPYLLLERISIGGMAEIFKARHEHSIDPSAFVVIKRILPHLGEDDRFITMFQDEAFFASELNHPTIPKCIDASFIDTERFMVLEHVAGQDLVSISQRLRKTDDKLSIDACLYICKQAALALDTAHRYQSSTGDQTPIVHRDVSPENIIVGYQGTIHVIDFGIARIEGRRAETQVGSFKGKLGYMTPEQIDGGMVDPRTDLFSLGSVLHELLSGQPVFVGENDFMTVDNVRKMEIKPPSHFNDGVSPELDALCLKALQRDPNKRYQDANRFIEAIDALNIIGSDAEQAKRLSTTLGLLFADVMIDEENRNERYARLEVLSDGDIVENAQPPEDTTSMWEPVAEPGVDPPTASMRAVNPQEVSLLGGRIDGTKPPAPLEDSADSSNLPDAEALHSPQASSVSPRPLPVDIPVKSPPSPNHLSPKASTRKTTDHPLRPTGQVQHVQDALQNALSGPNDPQVARLNSSNIHQERTREVSAPFPLETGSSHSIGLSSELEISSIRRFRPPIILGLTIVLGLLCAQVIVKLVTPQATGSLIVKVQPASPLTVSFDNESVNVDTAPFVLRTIKVGQHKLTVQSPNHAPHTETVEIGNNETKTLNVSMTRTVKKIDTARLKLITLPRNAQVRLTNSADALQQNEFLKFNANKRLEFVAELGGFESRTVAHTLRADETRTVLIQLEPSEGTIMVDSQPPADIFVNGRRRGRSPTTLRHLDINQIWKVELVAKGYRTMRKTIKFNGRRLVRIDEKLQQVRGRRR